MMNFFKKRKGSASVAKDRLKLIIQSSRTFDEEDIDIDMFEKDLLEVFQKHLGKDKISEIDLKMTAEEIDVSAGFEKKE